MHCISILLFAAVLALHADSYSGSSADEAMIIRAPVWVFLESQPGIMDDDFQGVKMPPRQALAEVSKTVLEGMTHGWTFSYTPFDKRRKVAEEFNIAPIHPISSDDINISITALRVEYPYLYCWAEYRITDAMALRKREWVRSNYVTVKGLGSAQRKEETAGVKHAYREAALAAVRGYLKKNQKNKPKHVHGEMLIKENPRLYAVSGTFKAEITVYLYIKEIVSYEVF